MRPSLQSEPDLHVGQISICGAFFQITHTQPLPHPTKDVGRVYPKLSRVSTLYRVWGGKTEDIFEKATLLYEGILNVRKIMNTASLFQGFLSGIVAECSEIGNQLTKKKAPR